jgi:hypothetical protein
MSFKSYIWKKKNQVSSGFGQTIAPASILLNPDQSSYRINRISDQSTRPDQI